MKKTISIIIPVYNEEKNIKPLYAELIKVLRPLSHNFNFIFVNDGSRDGTMEQLEALQAADNRVTALDFSRNFGKESATTAGLHHAANSAADAALLIDADLQHPVALIPEFLKAWHEGADVVVGVRNKSKSENAVKRTGSYFFYEIMNRISDTGIMPGETDYRLLDRAVIEEFKKLTERSRMTRGLINWLGFKRHYIYFDAKEREHGDSGFSLIKLFRLAVSSFVSHSLMPLRMAGYLGALITLISFILGIVEFLDRYLFNWGLAFSGPAILATILLFLVGIILMAIGILAVYVGNVHQEVQNRPLYIIRKAR